MTLDEYIALYRGDERTWLFHPSTPQPLFRNGCVRIAWHLCEQRVIEALRRGLRVSWAWQLKWACDLIDAAWEEPTGMVYEVSPPHFVNGESLCKIGYSKDTASRVRQLQTGSVVELVVVREVPGSPRLEQGLHEALGAFRRHGEWFEFSDDQRVLFDVLELVGEAWAIERLRQGP